MCNRVNSVVPPARAVHEAWANWQVHKPLHQMLATSSCRLLVRLGQAKNQYNTQWKACLNHAPVICFYSAPTFDSQTQSMLLLHSAESGTFRVLFPFHTEQVQCEMGIKHGKFASPKQEKSSNINQTRSSTCRGKTLKSTYFKYRKNSDDVSDLSVYCMLHVRTSAYILNI